MRLNTLKPAEGSKKQGKRLGRGHSAGQGKTSGRGVKGQHSRSGGFHKVGFEGGQMPLQRRLPKIGFKSLKGKYSVEVRLGELGKVEGGEITADSLKAAGVVPHFAKNVKVIASGEVTTAVKLTGIKVTPGARVAIEAAGGSIAE
jgi:large subunit ribosomal protein L15